MPYLTINGTPTYYEESGEGPALLQLHAGFCSLETTRPQIEALAERFRVYAIDRPGHGRTADQAGPYHYATMVRDTIAFMDALGVTDADLLGFSDGAIIALEVARAHPARVRSLITISANLAPDGFVSDATQELEPAPSGATHRPDTAKDEAIEQRLRKQHAGLSPDGPDHHAVVIEKLLALWRSEPQIPARSLASVRAPTLVIAAEHDIVRANHTRLIARNIPHAQVCFIARATHMTLIEGPRFLTDVINRFLLEQSLPGLL